VKCTRTANRIRDMLDGRKLRSAKKYKHRGALPMKPFIRSETFGRPQTGGFARSHTGKHYARYWCRTTDCHVGRSREELDPLRRSVDPAFTDH
jgi:hypothetical protein